MQPISIKTDSDLEKMKQGGEKLSRVKNRLKRAVASGVSTFEVEKLANEAIEAEGAKASFKMVKGYKWATCINVNDGLVHGIPEKELIFRKGDVVSVDVGLFYGGFHTDTSFSVDIEGPDAVKKFLGLGKDALASAITEARPNNRIYDISAAIERTIESAGFTPIRALVGHGVGRSLHEEPAIPCFTAGKRADSPEIKAGMVLAIEVMYAQGAPDIVLDSDGWTIRMADGKISALFEETVAVTRHGPIVITDKN